MKLLFFFSLFSTFVTSKEVFDNQCYYGADLADVPNGITDLEGDTDLWKAFACKHACEARDDCEVFFYRADWKRCFLKGNNPTKQDRSTNCYSNRVGCHDTGTIIVTKMEPVGAPELVASQDVTIYNCIGAGGSVTNTMTFQYTETSTITWDESTTLGGSASFKSTENLIFAQAEETFTADLHHTWSNGGSKSTAVQTTASITGGWEKQDFMQAGVMTGKNNVFKQLVDISFNSCSGDTRQMRASVTANHMAANAETTHQFCIKNGKENACTTGSGKNAGCENGGSDPTQYMQCDHSCNFDDKIASCRARVLYLLPTNNHDVPAAIKQVNQDCQSQCSCQFESWPPLAGPTKAEL